MRRVQSCTFCASVIRTARRCSASSLFAPPPLNLRSPAPPAAPPAPPLAPPPAPPPAEDERSFSRLGERTSCFESASSLN